MNQPNNPIPDHWVAVTHGMSGVWIERNVTPNDTWNLSEKIDVIHVPAWNLRYPVEAGEFATDRQIQILVSIYSWGVEKGIEQGKDQAKEAIRDALGIYKR